MRKDVRPKLRILVIIAAVAAGGYTAARLILWRHEQSKTRRIEELRETIWRHAQAAALPPELVEAVIRAESGGDPTAVSRKNARGLMQITPIAERDVLRRTGIEGGDIFDVDYNVRIGTIYLRMLINRFGGDLHLALAAYNAGPTKIARLRKAHPGLTSKRLVERHAPRATARYCRAILVGRSVRLPVTDGPGR